MKRFERSEHVPATKKQIKATAKTTGTSIKATARMFAEMDRRDEVWVNDKYTVHVRPELVVEKKW